MPSFWKKEWLGIHALACMWGFEDAKAASEESLLVPSPGTPSPQVNHAVAANGGIIVPQLLPPSYIVQGQHGRVEVTQLDPSVKFLVTSPSGVRAGISLRDAISSRFLRLVDRYETPFQGSGYSISLRLFVRVSYPSLCALWFSHKKIFPHSGMDICLGVDRFLLVIFKAHQVQSQSLSSQRMQRSQFNALSMYV